MAKKVTKEDLNRYIKENYRQDTVDDITKPSKIFEAFSEMVVELNPDYEISLLTEAYEEQDLNMSEFLELKLDEVVDDSIQNILSQPQKNKWVKFAKNGIKEYQYINEEESSTQSTDFRIND